MVAVDTFDAVATYTRRARKKGQLIRHIAYFALWLMIFIMSYT